MVAAPTTLAPIAPTRLLTCATAGGFETARQWQQRRCNRHGPITSSHAAARNPASASTTAAAPAPKREAAAVIAAAASTAGAVAAEDLLLRGASPSEPALLNELTQSAAKRSRPLLKDMSKTEMEQWVRDELGEADGQRRAKQLWKWLYRDGYWASSVDDMQDVSRDFRGRLRSSGARFDALRLVAVRTALDGTKKILFELVGDVEAEDQGGMAVDASGGSAAAAARLIVETVVIPHRNHPSSKQPSSFATASDAGSGGSSDDEVYDESTGHSYGGDEGTKDFHANSLSERGTRSSNSRSSTITNSAAAASSRGGGGGGGGGGSSSTARALLSNARRRHERNTVCVSCQVGCAMGCKFCYTAKMGLLQNLTAGQIVDQVVQVRRLFTHEIGPITNVVFMGMGEPMHNLDNVVKAVDTLADEQGLHCSPTRTTVSTCGLVPEMTEFCRRSNGSLALSLHATTDEVRSRIMPINRRYPITELLDCLKRELAGKVKEEEKEKEKEGNSAEWHKRKRKGSHVFVEYLLLDGVNDSHDDALRLLTLMRDIPCKINLITFNSHDAAAEFQPTPLDRALEFQDVLVKGGAKAYLRKSRGDDAMMACGQLGTPRNFISQTF